MDKLYLVTKTGERHEDHIPCGVFTFSELKKRFPGIYEETDFFPNKWEEICVLNIGDFRFSNDEISSITSSKVSFKKYMNYIQGFKMLDNGEPELDLEGRFIQEEKDSYDGQFVTMNVIEIAVNEEMDYT